MRALLTLILVTIVSGAIAQETGVLPPLIKTYSTAVVTEEKCCGWQDIPKGAEQQALETLRGRAYRNGIVLQLQLDGDRSLKFIDDTAVGGSCEMYTMCRKHRLIGYWPKHRQYIVEVTLWEGQEAFLVSSRDGRLLPVAGPPLLSPSGEYAIAVDSLAYPNGYSELIDLRQDLPTGSRLGNLPACPGRRELFGLRPFPVWLDNSQVAFEGQSLDPNDSPNAKQILRIVDGKPEWEC